MVGSQTWCISESPEVFLRSGLPGPSPRQAGSAEEAQDCLFVKSTFRASSDPLGWLTRSGTRKPLD